MQQVTVEIHDICPPLLEEVEAIAFALHRIGVSRPTLLAVPRYRDASGRDWDLRDHPETVTWLRARQAQGAEIVQHGLTHRAPAPPPPGLGSWFMHHVFARGCAEFAHLDETTAARRLARGRRILADCGLSARGFIAPAWQQSRATVRAVYKAGYTFTAFLNHVVPLRSARPAQRTPALTFVATHALVDHAKRGVMRGLAVLARRSPLLRVAIHPDDVHRGELLGHIVRLVSQLLHRRHLTTYAAWLTPAGPGSES